MPPILHSSFAVVNIRRKHDDTEVLAEALLGLAKIGKQRREFEKAEELLTECLEIQEKLGNELDEYWLQIGHARSLNQKFEAAANAYEEISQDAADFNKRLILAHVSLAREEFGIALQTYRDLDQSPEVILGGAIARALLGNTVDALIDITVMRKLDCSATWLSLSYLLEGDILQHNQKEEEAQQAWRQAMAWSSISAFAERRLNGGVGLFRGQDKDGTDTERDFLCRVLLFSCARES